MFRGIQPTIVPTALRPIAKALVRAKVIAVPCPFYHAALSFFMVSRR